MASSRDELQTAVESIAETAKRIGMRVNVGKTKTVTSGVSNDPNERLSSFISNFELQRPVCRESSRPRWPQHRFQSSRDLAIIVHVGPSRFVISSSHLNGGLPSGRFRSRGQHSTTARVHRTSVNRAPPSGTCSPHTLRSHQQMFSFVPWQRQY